MSAGASSEGRWIQAGEAHWEETNRWPKDVLVARTNQTETARGDATQDEANGAGARGVDGVGREAEGEETGRRVESV